MAAWKEILIRTAKESAKDNVGLAAAGVAFYAFLALVPLMGATVLTYGLVASPHTVLKNMESLASVMPADVAKLVGDQLMNVVQSSSGKKGLGLLAAIGVALFGARNAAGAIITALNIAYEEEEKRGLVKVTALAIGMTIAAVVVALVAVATVAMLNYLSSLIPGAPAPVLLAIRVASGALALAAAAAGAATLYRIAPSRSNAQWRWLTAGTLLTAIGWLALIFAFGLYVDNFAHYGATYGSIGGVVALLTLLYLSSYIFLFGAELNSEVEHQTAVDTTTGDADPLGERGAWSADHVADRPDDPGKEVAPVAAIAPADVIEPKGGAYLASRITSRAAGLAGGARIGIAASALSTIGLGLLRRRGRKGIGALLVVTAAAVSLLRSSDD